MNTVTATTENGHLAALKHAYERWDKSKGTSVDEWMALLGDDIKFNSIAAGAAHVAYMTTYDRKQALRKAFMATMKDPGFLADAEKLKLDVSASDGEGVEKLFARFFSYPQSAVDKAVASMRD